MRGRFCRCAWVLALAWAGVALGAPTPSGPGGMPSMPSPGTSALSKPLPGPVPLPRRWEGQDGQAPSAAGVQEGDSSWYGDGKRGWFWYENPPEEESEEPEEPMATPPDPRVPPSLREYTMQELWEMHPDDFQLLLMGFMKKAVQDPSSVEAATEYKTMEDIARRKSLAFANTMTYVVQTNPAFLNMDRDVPTAVPGILTEQKVQFQEIETRVASERGNYGLLYFYSPSCQYCVKQNPIVEHFIKKTRWDVKSVDISQQQDLAVMFGVETTPTIYMIARNSQEYMPVGMGLTVYSDILERCYRAIRLIEGEVSPDQFNLMPSEEGGLLDPKSIFEKNPMDWLEKVNESTWSPVAPR